MIYLVKEVPLWSDVSKTGDRRDMLLFCEGKTFDFREVLKKRQIDSTIIYFLVIHALFSYIEYHSRKFN